MYGCAYAMDITYSLMVIAMWLYVNYSQEKILVDIRRLALVKASRRYENDIDKSSFARFKLYITSISRNILKLYSFMLPLDIIIIVSGALGVKSLAAMTIVNAFCTLLFLFPLSI